MLAAVLAATGAVAHASEPPVVAVGPVSSPTGAATASGSAGSTGETDACLNNQHSGVSPSPSNAAQVTDRACTAAASTDGSTQPAGGQASKTRAPAQSGGGSRSGGNTSSRGTAHAAAVTAANATGLRIASIRITTRGIAKARRFSVLVTIRDQRKRLVRYAVISLGCSHAARGIAGCTQSTFSNRGGQATFRLRLTKHLAARHLSIAITARTPHARVRKLVSMHLPKPTTRSHR
jgi:hypothetical protein